ncbi:uncharacterized protein LOC141718163 [Apium graveolens]|uniref:uncharacterized protein LOC141718163 n=1 Tax=Apium graveolens TaxID=4045 RepID=UPI003D7968F7
MPDSTSSDFNKWTRNDYMVMSWLTFSTEQVISDSFIFASTARDLWLDVSERFGKSNAPLLYELQTSLSKIEQNNLSIAEYYGKLKNVWDKLQKANEAAETKKLIQLICGLNKNYDNVKTNMLSMEPLPTILKAYHILEQIEKQQSMTINMSKVPDVSVFYSNKPSFSVPRSFQNKKDFKRSKLDLTCDHYKKKGHTVDQCFKLTGVPEWYMNLKGKNFGVSTKFAANIADTSGLLRASPLDISSGSNISPAAQSMDPQLVSHVYKEIMKMMQQNAGLSISEHDSSSVNFAGIVSTSTISCSANFASWIIDTGASDHMVFSLSLFDDLQILQEPIKIALPDGSCKLVSQSGTISLFPHIRLTNVLYIPYFHHNLLSVGKLLDSNNLIAKFDKDSCLFQDLSTNTVKAVGTRSNGLYNCDSCILAKHHTLPFNDSLSIALASFHLLHIYLWGPYQTPNLTGGRYFLTILDDFSRVTWTHLLTTKDQVFSIIQAFLVYIDNHYQNSVKFVRSDNGTEIVQQNCANLFASRGIVHQKSIVGNPQQNGRVEIKHRHLFDTARAIRIHANLPTKFWGNCILAATYLIILMPSSVLGWKIPYEVLMKKSASYENLRTIGCLCFAAIKTTDKLAPRARRCILLGYPYAQKGYKLYDLATHQVFLSRDVIFKEDYFPFKTPVSSPIVPTLPHVNPVVSEFDSEMITPFSSDLPPVIDNTSADSPTSTSSDIFIPHTTSDIIPLRRTSRLSQLPKKFDDFVLPTGKSTSLASPVTSHIFNVFSEPSLSHLDHHNLTSLNSVLNTSEPSSYKQAKEDPRWVEAMQKEIVALEANETWDLTPLPLGGHVIGSK